MYFVVKPFSEKKNKIFFITIFISADVKTQTPEMITKDYDESKISQSKSSESHDPEDTGQSKSIFEGNGFTIIKKIGTGSYSKVKVWI